MSSSNEFSVGNHQVSLNEGQDQNENFYMIYEAKETEPPEKVQQKPNYPMPMSLLELFLNDIEPIRFYVEALIPQGLSILAGAPKTGKSFLCLMLAIAVGLDRALFETFKTSKSEVLLLSLEDGLQIIKNRLSKMVAVNELASSINIRASWGRSFDENLNYLEEYLSDNRGTGLVIIDTISLFCSSSKRGSYQSDYSAANRIKAVADKYGVAIVATHHTVKKVGHDWLSALYGSHGFVAAADAILFLDRQRGSNMAQLKMTGRNVEANTYGIKFDPSSCIWDLVEHGYEIDLQPERLEIVKLLNAHKQPMKLSEIANALGKSVTNVQNLLKKLIKLELAVKTAHGVYALAPGLKVPDSVESMDSMEITEKPTIDQVNLMDSVESVDFRHHWS